MFSAGCGGGGGAAGDSVATGTTGTGAVNSAPLADAGPDQNVSTGTAVILDGSASRDPDNDPLTYLWTLASAPPGSGAVLNDRSLPRPSFSADLDGTYLVSLVVNDGALDSLADTVTITAVTGNSAPVADAGPDQNVLTGWEVHLDGSGSSDADNDPLSYLWTLTARPPGSTAALVNAASVSSGFVADLAGAYAVSLVVQDGKVSSAVDTVTVTAVFSNSAPVADAGPDQNVIIGSAVTLDGSASSDINGDSLSYHWTLTSRPSGSAAVLSGTDSVTPSLTADQPGQYVVSLVVNDGAVDSVADSVTVTAALNPLTVSPLSPNNGADWNAYVRRKDFTSSYSATDFACNPATDTDCLHGGELRVVAVPGRNSCSGLSATDALGVFLWRCDETTGSARFVSAEMAYGKGLADLIDFSGPGWRPNSVTVYDNGSVWGVSPVAVWWSNPVVADNDGGTLAGEGTIYVVTNDALTAGYTIGAHAVGLVVKPGVVVNLPGADNSARLVSSTSFNFLWLEGAFDAGNFGYAVVLNLGKFCRLHRLEADNAFYTGIHLYRSDYNQLSYVKALQNADGIWLASSSHNSLNWATASVNDNIGLRLTDASFNDLVGLSAFSNGVSGVGLDSVADSNTFTEIVAMNNGSDGVALGDASTNAFYRTDAINNGGAGFAIGGNGNTFAGVEANNNGTTGISLITCSGNVLSQVMADNNPTGGIYLYNTWDNSLAWVTAVNNGDFGIFLGAASHNVLAGVSAVNNAGAGLLFNSSTSNTILQAEASNNGSMGIWLAAGGGNTFSGTSASDNGSTGYNLAFSSNNYFTDLLQVGQNGTADCAVALGTNPGLNSDCTAQGASDFGAPVRSLSTVSSFSGKLLTDDPYNSSDVNGSAAYPLLPSNFDWRLFYNAYRGWGPDGLAYPSADNRGQWTAGNGRIWDWSLRTGDGVLRARLPLPNGNQTLTHTWSDSSTTTLLRRAVETWGNGNGVCESGETCLYLPNLASYQGHGVLVSAGTFSPGVLTGITLQKYVTNGR